MPSVTHSGGRILSALPRLPWKRMWNWKMWVSSWPMSWNIASSDRSAGMTIRLRAGVEKAPVPSGMKLTRMLFCSNAEWVA